MFQNTLTAYQLLQAVFLAERMLLGLGLFVGMQNGDVVATRQIAPCRRVVRDVNGGVLFVEHLAACESGTVVHDVSGRGLYDRETLVSFKGAFFEA